MPRADLHLHSNKSDGILTPSEVVYEASKRNLAAIAITDHDTVKGIPEALRAGKKYGINVVPGIEINTSADNGELHILGYFIDHNDRDLIDRLEAFKKFRMNRTLAIIKKLNHLGIEVSEEQIISEAKDADVTGRPHIARALYKNGYVSSFKEAFEKYIGRGRPAYVERHVLLPKDAITLIKGCGGVPVLAHPGMLSNNSFIELCIDTGIQGIEAFHSRHNENQSAAYAEIADRHNLIITGGSDCHGDRRFDGYMLLGRFTVDAGAVKRLKDASDYNRQMLKNKKHHV